MSKKDDKLNAFARTVHKVSDTVDDLITSSKINPGVVIVYGITLAIFIPFFLKFFNIL